MSSVYLAIGLCVLGVGMLLTSGWLALFWLAAGSGVAAIVPTVLDEVRWKKAINGGTGSGSRRYWKGTGRLL